VTDGKPQGGAPASATAAACARRRRAEDGGESNPSITVEERDRAL